MNFGSIYDCLWELVGGYRMKIQLPEQTPSYLRLVHPWLILHLQPHANTQTLQNPARFQRVVALSWKDG
jgi:hypothetical protein